MRKKRGQITIFIIVGALLLLSLALLLIFKKTSIVFTPERVSPTEADAITSLIDKCIKQTGENALGILGSQGGHIYLPEDTANDPSAALDLYAGIIKIPYWETDYEVRVPSLQYMQDQLSRYVTENLKGCINNLKEFQDQFVITEKGPLRSRTVIADQVIFKVDYPIEIKDKEGRKITDLTTTRNIASPYKLKDLWEIGKAIVEKENKDAELEQITVDLIAIDNDIPISGIDLGSRKRWNVNDIRNKLKALLRINLPRLRIEKTSTNPFLSWENYAKHQYVWRVTDISYPDAAVSISFQDSFPFELAVSPSDGNTLRSGNIKGTRMLSFLGLQMWKYTYDITYPALITVEDKKNNFALNFAVQVRVRSNLPGRKNKERIKQFNVDPAMDEAGYCSDRRPYKVKIYSWKNVSSSVESYQDSLNGVNISYTCLKYTCKEGSTRYEEGGAAAVLEEHFPYCINGILRAKKKGFTDYEKFISTDSDKEVSIDLRPLKEFNNISVVKYYADDNYISERVDNPTLIIDIKGADNYSRGYESSATIYSSNASKPLILLDEGTFTYNVEAYLISGKDIIGGYKGNVTLPGDDISGDSMEIGVVTKKNFAGDMERSAFMIGIDKFSRNIAGIKIS